MRHSYDGPLVTSARIPTSELPPFGHLVTASLCGRMRGSPQSRATTPLFEEAES